MSNQYACLNTKIMAMKGFNLNDADYMKMIAAPDVSGVFDLLKTQRIYEAVFYDFDISQGIHRQEIEWRLKRHQVNQAEKYFYYIKGNEKKLIENLLNPLEISAISILLRGLMTGEDLKSLLPSLVWSKRASLVNFDTLVASENWIAFKENLRHTPYFRLLEIFPELNDESDLFQIEKTIERYHYDQLNQILTRYKGKNDQLMVQTLRREIDLTNLVWIYRGKFTYHLSREILIAFTLIGGEALSPKKLIDLIEAEDYSVFLQIVNTIPDYQFLFNHTKTLNLYMERRKSRYLYYAFKKLFQISDGIGKAVAFIRMIGFEIQDIISIIESKRYNMNDDATKAFIIRDFAQVE